MGWNRFLKMVETERKTSFKVRVTADSLNYRTGAVVQYKINGLIKDQGVCTIIDQKNSLGKLKSKAGKVLWPGVYYMTANQTATLSEKVSEQPNGIVLVFSRYVGGVAENYAFNSFFVPKILIDTHHGTGHTFTMNSSAIFGVLGAKYLYLHDTEITGNADNNKSGTASSGITYNNAGYVLRYVIGV